MKKVLILIASLVAIPALAFAATVPVTVTRDTVGGFIRPSILTDFIQSIYFTSTSVTNHSTFPYASSTSFTVGNLFSTNASTTNLIISSAGGSTGCAQFSSIGLITNTGTACGTGGGGSYPFTPTTNFSVAVQATSGIPWFQNGLQASSTSQFAATTTFWGNPVNNQNHVIAPPATYVVATTSSLGDFTDLNAAISSLPTSGGSIHLTCGVFIQSTSTALARNNLVIEGEGGCTVLQYNLSVGQAAMYNFDPIKTQGVVRDLVLKNSNTGHGYGIRLDHRKNISLSDIDIIDFNVGVMASSSSTFYNNFDNLNIYPAGTDTEGRNFGYFFANSANFNHINGGRVFNFSPQSTASTTGVSIDAGYNDVRNLDSSGNDIGVEIRDGAGGTSLNHVHLESDYTAVKFSGASVTSISIDDSTQISGSLVQDFDGLNKCNGCTINTYRQFAPFSTYTGSAYGFGTSSPLFNVDVYSSSTKAALRVQGNGSFEVQSEIQLESTSIFRGAGTFHFADLSGEMWYYGNCYNSNGAFCVNYMATTTAATTTTAANPLGKGVSNLLFLDNTGNFGLSTSTLDTKLAIALNTGAISSTTVYAIKVASSTQSATTTIFSVDNTGLIFTTLTNGCVQAASGVLTSTGSSCGSSSNGASPFTFGTSNFSTTTAATTSSVWLNGGSLFSSSTQASVFPYASSTLLTTDNLWVNLGANQVARFNDNSNASGFWGLSLGFLSQSGQAQIVTGGTNAFVFYTGGTRNTMTAGTERMRMLTGGGFGIATSAPREQLSVSSSTGPQFGYLSGTNNNSFVGRNQEGTFWFGTSTIVGSTSTNPAFSIDANAIVTFTSGIKDSALTSGNCVQAGTGGLLTTTGSACGAGVSTDFTFGASNFSTSTAATTSSLWTKGVIFSSSTVATSTFAGDFFIGSPQVLPNPLLVIATSSRAPFYGRIPGDGLVLELDWNNNSAINVVNSAVGSCANAGFFADGNSPTLTGFLGFFGFLNDGWTGVNCPIGNLPGPRPESVLLWNPTGDIDVVVSSTTSAFNILVGGNYATDTVMTMSTTSFKVNDRYSTNVLTVNTASTTWPYDLFEGFTATSTGPIFSVDSAGHLMASSTFPTLSSCGTSPSLSGDSSDFSGTITVGSVAATGCTLTFGNVHTVATHCVISNQSMSVANAMTYTETTSGFVVSQTGLTSAKLDYICTGK